MSNREQLGLRVPVEDVERFEDALIEKYGQKAPYAGTELEHELRAFLERGAIAEIEAQVDRLTKAAGARPSDTHDKKSPRSPSRTTGPTRIVNYRIHPDVLTKFKSYVQRESETTPGRVVGKIMRAYADGGTRERILRKLDRVVEDAEGLLSSYDPESDGRLTARSRRIARITNELTPAAGLKQDKIDAEIKASGISSKQTIAGYRKEVLDRLDFAQHPKVDDLYLPQDEVDGLVSASESGKVGFSDYDAMSRDERVTWLQVDLCERALANGGKKQIDAQTIEKDSFDNHFSTGYSYKLMDIAAEADGFQIREANGKKHLRVNLEEITDTNILAAVDDGTSDTKWARARIESEQLKNAARTPSDSESTGN